MCARYLTFEEWADTAFFELAPYAHTQAPARQIRPADPAPVFIQSGEHISAEAMRWGFPMQRSGVIFNARAETLEEKPLFRDAYRLRRCIVPALGFYEWDSQTGQCYIFRAKGDGIVYMAGIYQEREGNARFVIVTTGACAPVSQVHMRMPLVLQAGQAIRWLESIEQARVLRCGCTVPLSGEHAAVSSAHPRKHLPAMEMIGSCSRI